MTFADRRLAPTLGRITREARRFSCFRSVLPHTEQDLAPWFRARHRDFIRRSTRGFGYYIWKPQVLLQAMGGLAEDEVVLYADAGCVLNASGETRLLEYAAMVREHPSGLLGFRLPTEERHYTKRDVLEHYAFVSEPELSSRQIAGGVLLMVNRSDTRAFVKRWRDECEIYPHLDDTPSKLPNGPGFVEHRHDQSHLSILFKRQSGLALPDETWWEGSWQENLHYPVHARRMIKSSVVGALRDFVGLRPPV